MRGHITTPSEVDVRFMRLALSLAKRACGNTSPNPLVGAVLVKHGKKIGQGWHRRAGEPHAEIEAIRNAEASGHNLQGATLYVSLEPCSTHGRTPPCVDSITAAGIARVVVAATDPNPKHAGKAYRLLEKAGVQVTRDVLASEAADLNEAFNHWIVRRTPFVTVKAAMTLDGKIATVSGESKWITGEKARSLGMKLRQGADAILVGINTVLTDDPRLTVRIPKGGGRKAGSGGQCLRRIILDSTARTPLEAKVVSDEFSKWTTVVVTRNAPKSRVARLSEKASVLVAPARKGKIDLRWLLEKLGSENVTSLLVEGGGEVNASFLLGGLAHRIAFFYAPKIVGGSLAPKAVGGRGVERLAEALQLRNVEWKRLGPDLLLTARLQ
jgi:diaminohydroxyphosphoribosylaminopyrimidine deaminase/5-amino-6-(5-phosphoribosylamino)uracil reductase